MVGKARVMMLLRTFRVGQAKDPTLQMTMIGALVGMSIKRISGRPIRVKKNGVTMVIVGSLLGIRMKTIGARIKTSGIRILIGRNSQRRVLQKNGQQVRLVGKTPTLGQRRVLQAKGQNKVVLARRTAPLRECQSFDRKRLHCSSKVAPRQ